MRSWKKAAAPADAVFLYFRAHPTTFFTPEHVAHQVGVGRRQTRRIVQILENLQKLEGVDVVTALRWGRPKRYFRAMRTADDSLDQLEVFQDALEASDLYAAFERRKP